MGTTAREAANGQRLCVLDQAYRDRSFRAPYIGVSLRLRLYVRIDIPPFFSMLLVIRKRRLV